MTLLISVYILLYIKHGIERTSCFVGYQNHTLMVKVNHLLLSVPYSAQFWIWRSVFTSKTGVLVCHQRIIVMGFEIPNCVEIKELNVGNLEIIHMVCLPKPATVRIKIYNINSDSIIKLDCSPTTTVGEMKSQIEELFYVESHLQKITLDGMELRDEQSIDLFNLKKVLFVLEF